MEGAMKESWMEDSPAPRRSFKSDCGPGGNLSGVLKDE